MTGAAGRAAPAGPRPRVLAHPGGRRAGDGVRRVGLLGHAEATMPVAWARWLAAALLVHALLVAPALLAAGWLVGRLPGAGGRRSAPG